MPPDFSIEDSCPAPACGVDEAGRGPLAGPVVAAAVVLRRDVFPKDILAQINDSKLLSPSRREYLAGKIYEYADVSIAACNVAEIDEINILQASLKAMKMAIEGLKTAPLIALIDGNKAPKLAFEARTVVKGDTKSLSIAAASIVAKQHRDAIMRAYSIEFPHYGWEKNAGYGTKQHLKALKTHGITPLHRRSFGPVAAALLQINS